MFSLWFPDSNKVNQCQALLSRGDSKNDFFTVLQKVDLRSGVFFCFNLMQQRTLDPL